MRRTSKASSAGSPLLLAALAIAALTLALGVSLAGASKGVLTFIGGTTTGTTGDFFNFPNGVAVNDAGGDIYAVDQVNNRVQQFSAAGAFIRAWGFDVDTGGGTGFEVCTQAASCKAGIAGSAPGQLSSPQGIAVDRASGDVYVSEQTNLRVQRFTATGAFVSMFGRDVNSTLPGTGAEVCTAASGDTCKIGTGGSAAGEFKSTFNGQLAIAPPGAPNAGNVLVADPANLRVQEFSAAGTFLRAFGWNVAAAGDPGDTDPANQFEVCTTACQSGVTGAGAGQFANSVNRVAESAAGTIYTVESTTNFRVQSFSHSGAGVTANGPFAPAALTGTASSNGPTDVAIGAAGNLLVTKATPAGATPACPDGSPSVAERRVLELSPAGAPQDTHMACAAIATGRGLAADPAAGRIYLTSITGGRRIYVLDDVAAPSAGASAPSAIGTHSATFEGTVDPNGSQTSYHFELSDDEGATWQPQPAGDAGAGDDPVAVSFEKKGLVPDAEYRYRLVAAKPFGNPRVITAPVVFDTLAAPPAVSIATTTGFEETAVLRSRLNPNNQATTYHFEYGPSEGYGSSTPEVAAGAGVNAVIVAAQIAGLKADSTYHYRIVATNATGTTEGPDRTVSTGDGRAYEMVSPVAKDGADILTDGSRTRAAADGEAVQYLSLRAFGDARGTGITTEYLAARGEDGWRTHSITPLHAPRPFSETIQSFDPRYGGELSDDLSTGVYTSKTPLTGDGDNVEGVANLYLRRDVDTPGDGSYELLSDAVAPINATTEVGGKYQPQYAGASEDFSHVVFTSTLNLTADAPPQPAGFVCEVLGVGCEPRLYEHTAAGLRLVGRVPAGPETSCTGLDCVPAERSVAGVSLELGDYTPGAISRDGDRIFFTVQTAGGAGDIYLREGGATTIKVNASEKAIPDASRPAKYQDASADGSKAFFTTEEQLVAEDTDSGAVGLDLYRYDLDAPLGARLTLLSVDEEPADGDNKSVQAVYGVSDDGEYVYFSGLSQLVSGAPPAQPGEVALFVWHEGELSFVGVHDDASDAIDNASTNWTLVNRHARVTPDGKHLMFVSRSPNQPTGDQSLPCAGGLPCARAYVYDADADNGAGELNCVSCLPDGAPSAGQVEYVTRRGQGGAMSESHLNRAISEDGRFAFFSSADRLVPEDSNGRYDAYAYDTVAGQVSLISTGQCNCDSFFVEADADGSDVFFTTRERLVGWDNDDLVDLYDARLGGGLPEPPPLPPSCQGDACQPPPVSLDDPTPASSGLTGPGDPDARGAKPRRCPQGKRRAKVRGKARCVKRKGATRKRRADNHRRASR